MARNKNKSDQSKTPESGDEMKQEIENSGEEKAKPDSGKTMDEGMVEILDVEKSEPYQKLYDKYLRLAAEFDNYKKRTAREFGRIVETAESDLILNLLQVVDDLQRAMNPAVGGADNLDTFKKGLELIYGKLGDILQKRGLKEIKAVGEPFNPLYHEAVMQKETDEVGDGIVIEEIQKGYFLNDKVLRPARVIVARAATHQNDNHIEGEEGFADE